MFRGHSSSTGRAERGSPYGPALRVAELLNKEPSPVKRYPQPGRFWRRTAPAAPPRARNCRPVTGFGHLREAGTSPEAEATPPPETVRGRSSRGIRIRAGMRRAIDPAMGFGTARRNPRSSRRRTGRHDGKRAASVPGGGPREYPQNYHERGKGRGGNRFVMKHFSEPFLPGARRGIKGGSCPADRHHLTDQP